MGDWSKRWAEAFQRARRFVSQDIWTIGGPGEEIPTGFIIKQIRTAILLVKNLMEGTLMLRAAALTFATILSIVPFLAIMFYLIQTFNLGDEIYEELKGRIQSSADRATDFISGKDEQITAESAGDLPDENAIISAEQTVSEDETSSDQPKLTPEEAERERKKHNRELQGRIIGAVFGDLGSQDEASMDPVQWLSDLADEAATNGRAISIAGILLVLTTVFGLMRNIENSFNEIWGVKRTRSWYRMFSDYAMIMLILPFVAAIVLGVTAALENQSIADSLGGLAYGLRGIQHVFIVLVFAALYYVVPNTHVRFSGALVGGIVAGTLWVILSWIYVKFQVGVPKYNPVFSTFALFPVLLMWIYLSWMTLLFGTELSFAFQNEKTFAMERLADGAPYAYREALALRAMIEVAHRFENGLPGLSREDASSEWNVPSRLINVTLDRLEECNFVTPSATEPVTYKLSRPAEKLTVSDIAHALREEGQDPSLFREDPLFKPIFDKLATRDDPFAQQTLAQLLEGYNTASEAD